MIPKIIFPNLESELVQSLNLLLSRVPSAVARNVKVSVRKPSNGKAVTVRSDGGFVENRVLKTENFGINIWADTFKDASELASFIEALLPLVPSVSPSIKNVSLSLSATRVNEEGATEQRYMTGSATVLGSNLTLNP